jgi:hypothetical protein
MPIGVSFAGSAFAENTVNTENEANKNMESTVEKIRVI